MLCCDLFFYLNTQEKAVEIEFLYSKKTERMKSTNIRILKYCKYLKYKLVFEYGPGF